MIIPCIDLQDGREREIVFMMGLGSTIEDVRELVQRILQRRANGWVRGEIQHYRRDWIRDARVRKSLTPWTS